MGSSSTWSPPSPPPLPTNPNSTSCSNKRLGAVVHHHHQPQSFQDALSISLGLSSSFGKGGSILASSIGMGNRDGLNLMSQNSGHYQTDSNDYNTSYNNNNDINNSNTQDSDYGNGNVPTTLFVDKLEGQTEYLAENDEYYNKHGNSMSGNVSRSSSLDELTKSSSSAPTTATATTKAAATVNERTGLLSSPIAEEQEDEEDEDIADIEAQALKKKSPISLAMHEIQTDFTLPNILTYTPAVILGTLLNILDALSYGMIIFPITEPLFSGLANVGLSMFYISCIISQVLFSMGWSQFKAGIGSEMIEVTPFFHAMALSILKDLTGADGTVDKDVVISTTITTYALSSMITGGIFFLLGYYRMGELVSYFPRHILVGCIGGVGYFLIITGIEISGGTGPLSYSWEYLTTKLLDFSTLCKISLAVVVTVGLLLVQLRLKNSLVLPSFYIAVLVLFHFIVIILPNLTLEDVRKAGYLFDTGSSSGATGGVSESWYDFYQLYRLTIVDWWLVFKQIPTILALTFFGILHVPINVPALAVSTQQESEVNVDRELIAHGMSNFISGLFGSIQNYLVYTNSLLFIRAGADSRLAGLMLALATAVVLISGSIIVSVIPVCVVGSLIFLLGYELLKEALYDTKDKTGRFEYFTIVVIVVTMGAYDFVGGVFVGVLLAFVDCVLDQSRTPVIRKEFTGEIARSTVVRHSLQDSFLSKIGKQIYVLKLQSYLFFGSIGGLEKRIQMLFESEKLPIRYLVLDFTSVLNVDFSASEGLNRIKKVVFEHGAFLIISLGDDKIYAKLDKVNLFEQHLNLKVFQELNSALEWSENEFLLKYKAYKSSNQPVVRKPTTTTTTTTAPTRSGRHPVNTPRNTSFLKEASNYLTSETTITNQLHHSSTFSKLFLFSIQSYTKTALTPDFWTPIIGRFTQTRISKFQRVFPTAAAASSSSNGHHMDDFIMVVETGSVLVGHKGSDVDQVSETFISRTLLGLIESTSSSSSSSSGSSSSGSAVNELQITAKTDSTVWILDQQSLLHIKEEHPEIFIELLLVLNQVNEKRRRLIMGYTLMSG